MTASTTRTIDVKAEPFLVTKRCLAEMFASQRLVQRMVAANWFEVVRQPLGWRTRGQATLKAIENEKQVLAKAGLKPPMKDKEQHNQWIVDTFVNRTGDSKQTVSVLRNLPEIWKHGGDLVAKEIVRRVNMDYDWKRKPMNPTTRAINGTDHLYFDTVPWRSVREFTAYREQWEKFRASTKVVLKTPDDLARFEDYRSVDVAKTGLKRSKKDAALTLAKRMFLRAYTRSVWGSCFSISLLFAV